LVVGCWGIEANSIDEDGGTAADAALGCDLFGGRAGDWVELKGFTTHTAEQEG
jgi:hypothetical protein